MTMMMTISRIWLRERILKVRWSERGARVEVERAGVEEKGLKRNIQASWVGFP